MSCQFFQGGELNGFWTSVIHVMVLMTVNPVRFLGFHHGAQRIWYNICDFLT